MTDAERGSLGIALVNQVNEPEYINWPTYSDLRRRVVPRSDFYTPSEAAKILRRPRFVLGILAHRHTSYIEPAATRLGDNEDYAQGYLRNSIEREIEWRENASLASKCYRVLRLIVGSF